MAAAENGERCPDCGRYCGVRYEWRGPHYAEVAACDCTDNEVNPDR